ncbi:hypothetical protein D3C87_1920020 [compost metagenome]
MKSTWIAGKTPEQKAELTSTFKASLLLRERLAAMLDAKIDNARKATRSKETYLDASWAYRQADSIGYERALSEVISLILDKNVEKE